VERTHLREKGKSNLSNVELREAGEIKIPRLKGRKLEKIRNGK